MHLAPRPALEDPPTFSSPFPALILSTSISSRQYQHVFPLQESPCEVLTRPCITSWTRQVSHAPRGSGSCCMLRGASRSRQIPADDAILPSTPSATHSLPHSGLRVVRGEEQHYIMLRNQCLRVVGFQNYHLTGMHNLEGSFCLRAVKNIASRHSLEPNNQKNLSPGGVGQIAPTGLDKFESRRIRYVIRSAFRALSSDGWLATVASLSLDIALHAAELHFWTAKRSADEAAAFVRFQKNRPVIFPWQNENLPAFRVELLAHK